MKGKTTLFSTLAQFGRLVRGRLGTNGLSPQQVEALWFIEDHGGVSMGDVGAYFRISAPSATFLINELVAGKYLLRKTDPRDRRLVCLSLTALGSRTLKQSLEERKKVLSAVLAPLSERDRSELERILRAIIDAHSN